MENKLISKSLLWMCVGLFVTFITGYIISANEVMFRNVYGGLYLLFAIIEIILVIFLSSRVMKMKSSTARVVFILYSFFTGLTFSSIFIVYNLSSILTVFLIASVLFGIMAFMGYNTKFDLTKVGSYLFFGLLAVIIVGLVNIFLASSALSLFISIICVIIFFGITAYDIQKLKRLQYSGIPEENLAIYGALQLYLDFINIFINLLNIFGDNR